MIYLGVLLGIAIMAAMVYMALDKKSSFQTRIASLIAIALMMITVVICVVLVFTDNRVPVDPSRLIVGEPVEATKQGGGNLIVILLLILFLIGIFTVIAVMAMRENKKHIKKDDGSGGFKL